ncbi:STN and carboxypeptidase regulatory-like domain-containing protein [Spirosoma telluris]|uniref:STN and carboxypeptidase regulatory-like domain-containing protein n=1 Tax=Spirosoma telluris TaxID=2183553 RepID=UPI002FC2A5C6
MRYFLILLFFFAPSRLVAQSVPPLDRLISVDIRNATLESALGQISRAGNFEFSYSPTRIDGKAVVTLRLVNTPVREVLNRVFQNQVTFKSRGNYVILVRAEAPEPTPKNFLLDGYILDEQTGERIAQASIFEKTTLASTVSNPFGYYRLRLSTDLPTVRLDVRKRAYVGETVLIRSRSTHSLSIRMTPCQLVCLWKLCPYA